MIQGNPVLIAAVRARFAHVDSCPFQGPRIYQENGGGALTLKSVVKTSATYAAVPDNQGRDNPAADALSSTIEKARADLRVLMNPVAGQFIVGETGTELLFRMIRTACLNVPKGSRVIGSSIEHPSSRSAAQHWASVAGMEYLNVPHDDSTGLVTAEQYASRMTPDVAVATILHASPVTGIGMDVGAIARAIRLRIARLFHHRRRYPARRTWSDESGGLRCRRLCDFTVQGIFAPLNLPDCIRISMCHYNTTDVVARTLTAIGEVICSKSQVAL